MASSTTTTLPEYVRVSDRYVDGCVIARTLDTNGDVYWVYQCDCPSAKTRNGIIIATCIVAAVSILAVASVLCVIFGYKKDRHDVIQRILAGMMLANAVYQLGNLVPAEYMDGRCVYIMTITEAGVFRTIWMMGKVCWRMYMYCRRASRPPLAHDNMYMCGGGRECRCICCIT